MDLYHVTATGPGRAKFTGRWRHQCFCHGAIRLGCCGAGLVWSRSFTTQEQPPDLVTYTNPTATDIVGVATNTILTWVSAARAASYNIYLGTANPPPLVASLAYNVTVSATSLAEKTVYYWRVDSVNTGGTTIGPVWKFRTIIRKPTVWTNPTVTINGTSIDVNGTANANGTL